MCSELTPRGRGVAECTGETVASAESNSETDDDHHVTLFTCSEDGCVKAFQRFSSLHKHCDLDGGSLKYALERESLLNKAMLRIAENVESGATSIEENIEAVISEESGKVSFVKVGCGLKHAHTRRRRLSDKKRTISSSSFFLVRRQGEKQMPVKCQKR